MRMGQYLTDLERLATYREMADRAHEAARRATTLETKNAHASMARAWETMIEELERLLESGKHDAHDLTPEAIRSAGRPINPDR
jgi:hypothetical protein